MGDRVVVRTDAAPAAVGPYSQAIRAGRLLFTAGQIPLSPEDGRIVGATVAEQTERALLNLQAVLEAGGSSLDRVVKTTVFLVDLSRFGEMNEVYARFFGAAPPARSTVEVGALPKGALVEVEAIALADGG
ncbi:MAG: RidA family protein [Candidatus Latescibacterota bacterium]|nr:MAG: RidA family protein [Candidatus Latescibacterota bacterium]